MVDVHVPAGASSRAAAALAVAAAAAVLVLAAADVGLHLAATGPVPLPDDDWLPLALSAAAVALPGGLLARARPRHPVGWLLLHAGLMLALGGAGESWAQFALDHNPPLPGAAVGLWLAQRFTALVAIAAPLLLLLFPTGRLPSRRWRPILWICLAASLALWIVGLLHPRPLFQTAPPPLGGMPNPTGVPALGGLLDALVPVVIPLSALAPLLALPAPFVRLRAARRAGLVAERAQLKWFAWGGAVLVASLVAAGRLPAPLGLVLSVAGPAALATAVAVAVLRWHLDGIDVVINRTVLYAALTACVVVGYVAVVSLLGLVLRARTSLTASLIATGVVAAAFSPLRERLHKAVDRITYGDRGDPYRALTRLGERLATATVADEVLPGVAGVVADALRVPYVAIEAAGGEVSTAGSVSGPPDDVRRLPLLYRGQTVGALVVTPRTPGARFSAEDERLLRDLARHAAVAVRAVALTGDLRRSRERIVTGREEERRRLRRDLHDGLGPALAAIAVRADAARPAVDEDPEVARQALDQIGVEARAALADVRRLVNDLRPPALDELGLARALAGQAQRFAPAVRVEVDAPDLGPLPAAVEVAAYRIVGEALANVVRHAGAATAGVRVRRGTGEDGDVLEVEVVDDGRGLEPDRKAGVGLASMRERAAELGGSCEIAARPEGGTRVRARLPLPAASPSGTEEEVVPA